MAFSSSIKRAQEIRLCDLCEEESVKWRCIDCDMCLCEKCKNFHLRVPVTSQHQIVTIGTPLKDIQKKIIIDNIPCKDHPRKMACLFCRSCDSLICPDCASGDHKKHNFDSIELALDEKLAYLGGIYNQIDANLKCCESKTSEINKTKPQYNAVFNESVTNIKQKEKYLIDVIRKHSMDLQEKVENERLQTNEILSKIEQAIGSTKKNLEDQRNEMDAILTSNQGSIIFKTTIEIDDMTFDSIPNQVQQFISLTESTKKIQKLFGSLQKLAIPTIHELPGLDFEVIKTFTTELSHISAVATLDETSAWISCWGKQIIRKMNIQDNTMTTSQELSLLLLDMAVTSNNELLLSVSNNSDVKMLKMSGEIVSFLAFASLVPYGIHVTKDNDIIVGVVDSGNQYTPTNESQRAVIRYGMDGKQKKRYQYDNDGRRMFTLPKRMTTHSNQDILVVDKTSDKTGRVICLAKEGNLRWFYEGRNEINATKKFDPKDIVTTDAGHIIISDVRSETLHVLSANGEVLTCKVMRDIGIEWPYGLDIDNKGRLWLGCDTAKNTGANAKLHIIKLIS